MISYIGLFTEVIILVTQYCSHVSTSDFYWPLYILERRFECWWKVETGYGFLSIMPWENSCSESGCVQRLWIVNRLKLWPISRNSFDKGWSPRRRAFTPLPNNKILPHKDQSDSAVVPPCQFKRKEKKEGFKLYTTKVCILGTLSLEDPDLDYTVVAL